MAQGVGSIRWTNGFYRPRNQSVHASAAVAEFWGVTVAAPGFSRILDEKLDDFNRRLFVPQIDGSKTGNELPGIVDEVITMAEMAAAGEGPLSSSWPAEPAGGQPYRAFVCHTLNPWGYPAKDRSGRLDAVEEPHLDRLMDKIRGPARPAAERLAFGLPAQSPDTTI